MMPNELIVQLYDEVFGRGRLELIEQLFATTFIDHSTPEQPTGTAGVAAYVLAVRTGFPDLEIIVDDLVVEGNTIAIRTTWRGTHLGMYEGVAPSGKKAQRTLMQLFRIANGLFAEEWNEGQSLLSSL